MKDVVSPEPKFSSENTKNSKEKKKAVKFQTHSKFNIY